jgi:hypothetical protein
MSVEKLAIKLGVISACRAEGKLPWSAQQDPQSCMINIGVDQAALGILAGLPWPGSVDGLLVLAVLLATGP